MKYDRCFAARLNGEIYQYVLVDTTETEHYCVPNRMGFANTVGFPLKTYRGEGNISMPVVFDDFTTSDASDGVTLEPIEWADVPAPIKRRHTKWLKYQ